jgi:glycosyltransferase involved in cell wall biosynthesis
MKNRPIVSIILYAYNEEAYVREAIESIFSQNYSPLEIVLSDDGSDDATYGIMEQMARDYSGPHRIILNRNPTNVGIGSQINAGVARTCGQLIILANADDVSRPDRIEKLVDAWLRPGEERAAAVGSSLRQIGPTGEPLGRVMDVRFPFQSLESAVRGRFGGPGAACLAIDRSVFETFGPLPDHLILEDTVLLAWAMLLGSIRYVEEPLVDYRVHDANISQTYSPGPFEEWRERTRSRTLWHNREGVKAYIEILRALHGRKVSGWSDDDVQRARWLAIEKLMENALLRDYYADESVVTDREKWGSLFRLTIVLIKTRIKRWFPSIERRNEKQQYQRLIDVNK